MNHLRIMVTLLLLVFATTPVLASVCASVLAPGCAEMRGDIDDGAKAMTSCSCDQEAPSDSHNDAGAMAELCALASAAALSHSPVAVPHLTYAASFPEMTAAVLSLNPPPPHKPPKG